MSFIALLVLCMVIVNKISVATNDIVSNDFPKGNFSPGQFFGADTAERIPDFLQDPGGSDMVSGVSGASKDCPPSHMRRPGRIRLRQDSACYPDSPLTGSNSGETGAGEGKKKLPNVPASAAPMGDRDSVDVPNPSAKNLILKEICPESFGPWKIPACSSPVADDTVCVGGICVLNNCERCMSTKYLRGCVTDSFYEPDWIETQTTYNCD